MKTFQRHIVLMLLCILPDVNSFSQKSDPGLLTLDRIFNSYEFSTEFFGPAKWLEDGSGYTTLEYSEEAYDKVDLVKYDAVTGTGTVLIKSDNTREYIIIQLQTSL